MDSGKINDRFRLHTEGPLDTGGKGSVRFTYRPGEVLKEGSRLWFLLDIRQGAGVPQCEDPVGPNFVSVSSEKGADVVCACYDARTLELYPQIPEFLHVCEMTLSRGMAKDDRLTISLGHGEAGWAFPRHPMKVYHFWLLEGGVRTFSPTGYRTYRSFEPPLDASPRAEVLSVCLEIRGEYPGLSAENTRPTPGILWGDLHGMAFNQRPLDDFYMYAREVARFDFAAAMLFSYNICVGDVWGEVKRTARRFTHPGAFVAVAGVEFGTPPDSSHRNAHFFYPDGAPPIFFEDRPPAHEPRLTRRFSPDTVFCRDLAHFYDIVGQHRGMVSGHFHTLRYEREILAEIWQKQSGSATEETRIFGLLNDGLRAGIVSGSDTHDSMPGNPAPEPHCPQPAGFMAVLADRATPDAIYEAILQRRVYGTTGGRIALGFEAAGQPMGSVLPGAAPRRFQVRAEGSAPLAKVELIHRGKVVDGADPSGFSWEGSLNGPVHPGSGADWHLVRVTQKDGHRAWSSPIWFEFD